ncbi:MAG: flagellar biosynthesis protein FlhB [Firmicutes bacterium]|nr:flagellar biosynthesis protein FlhB [Bacillota bacterium]
MKKKKKLTAVALKYDQATTPVPTITASGRGRLAEKIVELAKKKQIPIQQNPPLAESLAQLPVGEEIPPDLYEAVAQILFYIMYTDQLLSETQQ